MARLWTRIVRSIPSFKKQSSKKLPVISLNDYKSLSYLNESIIYSPHLLNISSLESACNALLLSISKNTPYWMIVNPFVQTWYLELERIHRCSQNALSILIQQIETLSHTLFEIFDMLWELGDLSLQHPLLLDHAVLDSNLLEAIKSAWQKKYAKNINKFQKLEDQLKTLLKQSSPSPNDFKCAVCLSILDDPITLSGCYHTFCRDCIQHIYCATCHKNHRHDSYKATTAVVCTCQRIHSLTGEPTTEEKPIVRCPLCRTEFKPTDCQHDKALSKFISLYFPKPPLPKHKVIASTIQRWSNQPSYYFDDDIFSLVARHSWMF
ncbi:hypothetical protein K501DRAFT_270104 [Backusella circina FSU 941]|nr:hypothetical protein K501DRAFT_270104 [Backusella circina FSU 941]